MPELSLEQLTSQLENAKQAYLHEVSSITRPYLRDKFTELLEKSTLSCRATWMPDELPVASMASSDKDSSPRLDGLRVVRIVTPKYTGDADEMKVKGKSIFDVIDGLLDKYVAELVKSGAERVAMPQLYVKREAYVVELFIYGFICRKDTP